MIASNAISVMDAATSIAASKLGRSLTKLDYPNGGKDAVFAEANLVAYLTHGLLSQHETFSCYAEASHSHGRRIDLLASNGTLAFAVEAKKFGDVESGCRGVIQDIQRLREFRPALSPLRENVVANEWWRQADERWGAIVVGSHAGPEVTEAWKAGGGDAGREALSRWSRRSRSTEGKHARSREMLLEALSILHSDPRAFTSTHPICEGSRWRECQDAHLLWALFPLD